MKIIKFFEYHTEEHIFNLLDKYKISHNDYNELFDDISNSEDFSQKEIDLFNDFDVYYQGEGVQEIDLNVCIKHSLYKKLYKNYPIGFIKLKDDYYLVSMNRGIDNIHKFKLDQFVELKRFLFLLKNLQKND